MGISLYYEIINFKLCFTDKLKQGMRSEKYEN